MDKYRLANRTLESISTEEKLGHIKVILHLDVIYAKNIIFLKFSLTKRNTS